MVKECCPEFRVHVDSWLACYKDPMLLYASLLREYQSQIPSADVTAADSVLEEEDLLGAADCSDDKIEVVRVPYRSSTSGSPSARANSAQRSSGGDSRQEEKKVNGQIS